jgi:AcrR family transcriptional regulator
VGTRSDTASDKRARLLDAGQALLHRQGFERTTLADVATLAKVPLGNVYYYFRTKDSLCQAVVDAHTAALSAQFALWERSADGPKERLRALVYAPRESLDAVLAFGCPHGSLCQELEKLGAESPLAQAAGRLMSCYLTWAEGQFRAMGWGARAHDRAVDLIAALQGAMLVGHTLRSPSVFKRALRRIDLSLETGAAPSLQRRKPPHRA